MLSDRVIGEDGQCKVENLYHFYKTKIEPKLLSSNSSLISNVLAIEGLKLTPLTYKEFIANTDVEEIDYVAEMVGTLKEESLAFAIPLNNSVKFSKELEEILHSKGFQLLQALKTLEAIFNGGGLLGGTGLNNFQLSLKVEQKAKDIQDFTKFSLQFNFNYYA